jgi:hypothetical protein
MKDQLSFKKTVALLYLIAILLLCFSLFSCKENSNSTHEDSYDKAITILTTSHPTQIIEYGEPIGFRDRLPVKKISSITHEALTNGSEEYERTVLIVNDSEGNTVITSDELNIIMQLVESCKLDFFYIGTSKQDTIKAYGIRNPDDGEIIVAEQQRSLALAFCRFGSIPVFIDSLWTDYDADQSGDFAAENLQLEILLTIKYYIEQEN